MFTFIACCFHRLLSGEIVELVEAKGASKFIYRDQLSKKKQSQNKQKSYYGDSKPLVKVKGGKDIKTNITGFDGKASNIRVKVKMTKQEAARLLSKSKEGGVLEFRDVVRELLDLPLDRVSVVSPCPLSNAVLDSIPEEY
ncbi:hypothetical protein REPUB_Repub07fG0180300 [Reevesia pubescens]